MAFLNLSFLRPFFSSALFFAGLLCFAFGLSAHAQLVIGGDESQNSVEIYAPGLPPAPVVNSDSWPWNIPLTGADLEQAAALSAEWKAKREERSHAAEAVSPVRGRELVDVLQDVKAAAASNQAKDIQPVPAETASVQPQKIEAKAIEPELAVPKPAEPKVGDLAQQIIGDAPVMSAPVMADAPSALAVPQKPQALQSGKSAPRALFGKAGQPLSAAASANLPATATPDANLPILVASAENNPLVKDLTKNAKVASLKVDSSPAVSAKPAVVGAAKPAVVVTPSAAVAVAAKPAAVGAPSAAAVVTPSAAAVVTPSAAVNALPSEAINLPAVLEKPDVAGLAPSPEAPVAAKIDLPNSPKLVVPPADLLQGVDQPLAAASAVQPNDMAVGKVSNINNNIAKNVTGTPVAKLQKALEQAPVVLPPEAKPDAVKSNIADAAPEAKPVAQPVSAAPLQDLKIEDKRMLIFFAAGREEVAAAAKAAMPRFLQDLKKPDARLKIESYASVAEGSSEREARRLSLTRALLVRGVLIEQGLDSGQMDIRALGAAAPEGLAKDVVVITKP